MVFIFQFVDIVYHIDLFAYIEESLHPSNKPTLIMVYELSNVLLNSDVWNFASMLVTIIIIFFYFHMATSQFCAAS